MSSHYHTQSGFSLFELMIAIAVIAILTAIGVPAYQSYIQKAAMTDMLQAMSPYKTSIEICALEQGGLTGCNSGGNGIPTTRSTSYVASINITTGIMTLIGQSALSGLTVTLTPVVNTIHGGLTWSRTCVTSPINNNLNEACQDVFKL